MKMKYGIFYFDIMEVCIKYIHITLYKKRYMYQIQNAASLKNIGDKSNDKEMLQA